MHKSRLEAFSDGVLAILITIMVLDLKIPHGTAFSDLLPLWPVFLSYLLSFLYLAIYWNNHHHMFQAVREVSGGILWANMHLLFWLSLIPFTTAWAGENHFAPLPVACYGIVLLGAALAYLLLAHALVCLHGKDSPFAKALGRDWKGKVSPLVYLAASGLAFFLPAAACAVYTLVALLWTIPDRRFARALRGKPAP
jgi:uncharacterized membrane protein